MCIEGLGCWLCVVQGLGALGEAWGQAVGSGSLFRVY